MNCVFIRCESIENEKRAPIVPKDIKRLLDAGITVFVQSSKNRIYKDSEYEKEGAIITNEPWYSEDFTNTLILGLKELDHLEKLDEHKHVYFSHSLKHQNGCETILHAFSTSKSLLYDFEYFTINKERYLSFGKYAGMVGAALGVKDDLQHLRSWSSFSSLIENLGGKDPTVAIIGSDGRCGSGVKHVLDLLNIKYTCFTKKDTITGLETYDIVYNCILLDESYTNVFFDEKTIFTKPIVIVDISCDYSKKNNPIKLYEKATSWENPVFHYNNYVSIIAIENLPSLLPKESSDEFSELCTNLLLSFGNDTWQRCADVYSRAINSLSKN